MEQEVSLQYLKGFNHGYLLRQHKPQIKVQDQGNEPSDYMQGFVDGGKQYTLEQKREQMRERFSKDQSQEKEQGFDRDR